MGELGYLNYRWSHSFEEAFKACIKDGVYPSPSNITERRAPNYRRRNKLSGDEAKQRIRLMAEYKVPYQRNGAYGNKGDVPNPNITWDERKKLKLYEERDINFYV